MTRRALSLIRSGVARRPTGLLSDPRSEGANWLDLSRGTPSLRSTCLLSDSRVGTSGWCLDNPDSTPLRALYYYGDAVVGPSASSSVYGWPRWSVVSWTKLELLCLSLPCWVSCIRNLDSRGDTKRWADWWNVLPNSLYLGGWHKGGTWGETTFTVTYFGAVRSNLTREDRAGVLAPLLCRPACRASACFGSHSDLLDDFLYRGGAP